MKSRASSTTGGTSWLPREVPSVPFPHDLEVDPNSADVLVMGVPSQGFRDTLEDVSALGFESTPSLEDQRLVRITKQL